MSIPNTQGRKYFCPEKELAGRYRKSFCQVIIKKLKNGGRNTEKLLKNNKIKPGDLSGVIVVSGPGGFTSVRIGVVTANTLGFALGIPVAGIRKAEGETAKDLIGEGLKRLKKIKVEEIVLPFYGQEPNITKPKKLVIDY